MFNLYPEPELFYRWAVFSTNALMYFLLFFSALHIYRLALYHKTQIVLSNWLIVGISASMVVLNYFGLIVNSVGFAAIYLLIAFVSWKWIPRKSLRWTNISIALFFLFTLSTYNLFNTKIQAITYPFFSYNDILEYSFTFKPYFEIFWPNSESLARVDFKVAGVQHVLEDEPLNFRIYFFYYIFHSFALIFWMIIFFDVLKKHIFTYKRVSENHIKTFLWSSPEKLSFKSWSSFFPFLSYIGIKVDDSKSLSKQNDSKEKLQEALVQKGDVSKVSEPVELIKAIEDIDKTTDVKIDKIEDRDILKIKKEENMHQVKPLETNSVVSTDKFESQSQALLNQSLDLREKSLAIREKNINLKEMKNELADLKNKLVIHPVFDKIDSLEHLKLFMSWHIFAVWDFMSLTKRLQQDLTCTTLPWMPPKNQKAARLMNDIVIGEETDKTPSGKNMSHFELYISAMREVGAPTSQIEHFMLLMNQGLNYRDALMKCGVNKDVLKFVNLTIETAIHGNTAAVLGSFFFGRENVIPPMFDRILSRWGVSREQAPLFTFYLDRHIELDSDEHGPAAMQLIDELFPEIDGQIDIYKSAIEAVKARLALWDALETYISNK